MWARTPFSSTLSTDLCKLWVILVMAMGAQRSGPHLASCAPAMLYKFFYLCTVRSVSMVPVVPLISCSSAYRGFILLYGVYTLIHSWTTVEPFGPAWLLCQDTETVRHADVPPLAPDHSVRSGTTQHWSDTCLSPSTELTSIEHARWNGNVHRWTSHMMR